MGHFEAASVVSDFACNCGDDGKKKMGEMVARVCEELGCEPENLVSSVVYALAQLGQRGVDVTGVPCDQWARVDAYAPELNTVFRIQCDTVEHGFAMLWEKAYALFPKGEE